MPKRYVVDLAPNERAQVVALTRKGKATARQVTRAHVLLHATDGMKDSEIAAAAHTSLPMVARIRKRFVQGRVRRHRTVSEGRQAQARPERGSPSDCPLL
jgi:transposase